ncbi:MAG TPA: cytochrome P450 [Ktedonobacteraceae bacterium]|jgi:cytochrome P450|nr:cytochrome P450 [Ktedonobacteraceae bacterium]
MQQPQRRARSFADFLPRSPEDIPQVYAWFERMRTSQPVFYTEQMPIWQVFRYEDVQTVLTDYNRFSSEETFGESSLLSNTLITTDPPDHRKLRNLVNQVFTPRAVARFSDRITVVTQDLLDEVKATGTMDVVSDMAFPLPAKIIAELLGVPAEDWDIFKRWARFGGAGPQQAPENGGPVRTMRDEMIDYFSDLLATRRKQPQDDLITSLSKAEIDGERLSEHELVSFCFLLLAAGQETTKNLIANAILCLTDHPDSLARLQQEPALMPGAIEEVLRYLPPVWFLFRRTKQEVELAGQHIPADQMVLAWTASANRDPAQFPEPDRFSIEREPNRHLAFGHGIHFCVGAPLARLEAKVVLPMMLAQLKDLKRVANVPINIHTGIVFVIESLPVTFSPA